MSNDNETKLTRRGFIALGSAGVAAAVAMPGSLFAAQPSGAGLLLSVGYWSGSAVLDRVSDWRKPVAGQFDVVDASSYEQGDFGFLQGTALLTVSGLGPSGPKTLRSLRLRAHFNADLNGGREMVPFEAWSYSVDGGEKVSPGVRFRMPVSPESGLSFSVEAELGDPRARAYRATPAATGKQEAWTTLALAGDGPKLMRGVYFLAVTDSPVTWSDYEFSLRETAGTGRRLVKQAWAGTTPAPFPYLIMTADLEVAQ
jgi:hypothetical protein